MLGKHPDGKWSVLLTPACDLVIRDNGKCNADRILLVRAHELRKAEIFKTWLEADREARLSTEAMPRGGYQGEEADRHRQALKASKEKSGELKQILGGKRDRYFHLPGFMEIPDLLLDLQDIETSPYETLSSLTQVASLNPPYAQALMNRLAQYVGRIGLEDPDTDWLLDQYRSETG